jgi:hypothetical protein
MCRKRKRRAFLLFPSGWQLPGLHVRGKSVHSRHTFGCFAVGLSHLRLRRVSPESLTIGSDPLTSFRVSCVTPPLRPPPRPYS